MIIPVLFLLAKRTKIVGVKSKTIKVSASELIFIA